MIKEFTCRRCGEKFLDEDYRYRKFCGVECQRNSINIKTNYDTVTYYALPGLMDDVKISFKPIAGGTTLNSIMEAVSNETNIPVEEIIGIDRKREIVKARHLFFYLAKKYSGKPLSAIGNTCYRDHTTVMHGVKATTEYIKNEDDLKQTLRKIEMTLV